MGRLAEPSNGWGVYIMPKPLEALENVTAAVALLR